MLSNQAIEEEAKEKEEDQSKSDDDSYNNKSSKLKKTSTTPKLFNLIKKDLKNIKKLDSREVCFIMRDLEMILEIG